MMPQLDGWQVIRALKADPALRNIPVVVVSIVAGENRGRILGVVEVLQKPVNRADLLAVLHRCLPFRNPRILVVDDEEDACRVLAAHLEEEPCELRLASNGREALEIMENYTPDLVLLDLMMPVMDGMTFLNRIRALPRFQFLPVVIVTARELTVAESEQLHRIAHDIVKKGDVFEADLKRVLQRFLRPVTPPNQGVSAMNPTPVSLLIVDDDPVFAQFVRQMVLSLGSDFPCSPEWADSAEKAMEQLRGGAYELVLLDYNLPGANGLQMLEQIRELPDRQPAVIMLTGSGNETIAVEAMKRGARDYLCKADLDVPPLVRALRNALTQKQLADQIASYNAQTRADLEMARNLQQSLLPDSYPSFPHAAAPEESDFRFAHRFCPGLRTGWGFLQRVPALRHARRHFHL